MRGTIPISVEQGERGLTRWDALAVLLTLGLLVFVAEASRHLLQPLVELQLAPLSLAPENLPEYAARTTLRMLLALVLSLVFTFTYATFAAKSRRAEVLLVPLLDILQSVPILGFISVTVVFFMSLAPGRVLGAEFAAIFAIFTSQAWNMAFSFYQSLRTVPVELAEASRTFRLSSWMYFWRVEAPFAMPQLIWNMMVSMSGSWKRSVSATQRSRCLVSAPILRWRSSKKIWLPSAGPSGRCWSSSCFTTSFCSGRWWPGQTVFASSNKWACCRRSRGSSTCCAALVSSPY